MVSNQRIMLPDAIDLKSLTADYKAQNDILSNMFNIVDADSKEKQRIKELQDGRNFQLELKDVDQKNALATLAKGQEYAGINRDADFANTMTSKSVDDAYAKENNLIQFAQSKDIAELENKYKIGQLSIEHDYSVKLADIENKYKLGQISTQEALKLKNDLKVQASELKLKLQTGAQQERIAYIQRGIDPTTMKPFDVNGGYKTSNMTPAQKMLNEEVGKSLVNKPITNTNIGKVHPLQQSFKNMFGEMYPSTTAEFTGAKLGQKVVESPWTSWLPNSERNAWDMTEQSKDFLNKAVDDLPNFLATNKRGSSYVNKPLEEQLQFYMDENNKDWDVDPDTGKMRIYNVEVKNGKKYRKVEK